MIEFLRIPIFRDAPIGVVVFFLVLVIAFSVWKRSKNGSAKIAYKRKGIKPSEEKPNDAVVVVGNLDIEKLKKDIREVCNLYNEVNFQMLPKLAIGDNTHVVTFPYGISFMHFCFFVNYINSYKLASGDYSYTVTGWITANAGEECVTDAIASQVVMMYVPDSDKEGDNVYVITETGEEYIIDFSSMVPKPVNVKTIAFIPYPSEAKTFTGKDTLYYD